MFPLSKYKINDDECLEFKKKSAARREVAAALKEGKLRRPLQCDLCTLEIAKLEAHHVDYGKPLAVYWLCSTCHGVVHKKNHPLNPNNNSQTPTFVGWRRDENHVVSFSLPFENFILIKKLADDLKITIPKFLRGIILKQFPVEDEQINFDFKVKRNHDNTQDDQIQGAQNLDQNQDALLQQKRQKLQELRRARHCDVSGVEELLHQVL
jgi:hypothetical protein